MLIANRTELKNEIQTYLAIWANKFIAAADCRLQTPRPYRIVTARKKMKRAQFLILLTQSDAIDDILDMAYDHFGKNRRARAFNVFLRNAYIGSVRKRKPFRRFHYYVAIRIQKKRKNKWDCELIASVDKFCPFGQVIHKTILMPAYPNVFEVRDGYVAKGQM